MGILQHFHFRQAAIGQHQPGIAIRNIREGALREPRAGLFDPGFIVRRADQSDVRPPRNVHPGCRMSWRRGRGNGRADGDPGRVFSSVVRISTRGTPEVRVMREEIRVTTVSFERDFRSGERQVEWGVPAQPAGIAGSGPDSTVTRFKCAVVRPVNAGRSSSCIHHRNRRHPGSD